MEDLPYTAEGLREHFSRRASAARMAARRLSRKKAQKPLPDKPKH
jgi:hypothetical protein